MSVSEFSLSLSNPINTFSSEMSPFAEGIYKQKYAWKDEDGEVVEDWNQTAIRVVTNVLEPLGFDDNSKEVKALIDLVQRRVFIPGGRYLYASGRPLHQTQNCLLMKAEDTREGWAELLSNAAMALQTGAGIGVDYSDIRPSGSPIRKTGGEASGPIPLMKMINEIGRGVMQGGARRSAIWAGLAWDHPDCMDFIYIKDWSDDVRNLKAKDFNFPADMEFTNVSVLLNDEFFEAYDNSSHMKHKLAHEIYRHTVKEMISTAEPGFSVDVGENAGETLRNAPVTAGTNVLTRKGYKPVGEIVNRPSTVWTGKRWANDVVFSLTESDAEILKVSMTGGREIRCEPNHEFLVDRYRGRGKRRKLIETERVKAKNLKPGDSLHVSYSGIEANGKRDDSAYTMGYIYGDGSFTVAGGAELTLCTEESKACAKAVVGHSSVNESDGRGYTRVHFPVSEEFRGRTKDQFPTEVYSRSPEKIASFLAGLFDADGNWSPEQNRIRMASKHKGFLRGVARALEQIGIMSHISKGGKGSYKGTPMFQLVVASESVVRFSQTVPTIRIQPELEGYKSYRPSQIKVESVEEDGTEDVFCADVKVPEHSFMAEGVIISNCTEVTSRDDSDICNLGSINLSRVSSKEEMDNAVRLGTLFLLAGTVYSHLPYDKVDRVRSKNRRLGLGLMGIHEWLLQRGYPYGPNDELAEWLDIYAKSDEYAQDFALQHGLSIPVKTRAIAPTGTIGIVAETTTGIEPIFCVAYKRRVKTAQALGGDKINYEYVVDPTAKRLIDAGADPNKIEDAYSLSYNYEKRIEFQAWVQQWVDHAISSTINLPYAITDHDEVEDFADTLIKYLPKLRGITVYPDGSRGGQPLTAVPLEAALGQEGVVFEEDEANACASGACGA